MSLKINGLIAFLMLFGFGRNEFFAQNYRQHHFKMDLAGTAVGNWQAAYEFRFSPKNSVEFGVVFRPFSKPDFPVFQGQLVNEFAVTEVDTIWRLPGFEQKLNPVSSKIYTGQSRPLPVIGNFLSTQNLWVRVAARVRWKTKLKKLDFYAHPAILVGRFSGFSIQDNLENEKFETVENVIGYKFQGEIYQRFKTSFITENREMIFRKKWAGGFSFDAGLSWQFSKKFALEFRAAPGVFISNNQFEKYKNPELKQYFFSGQVFLVYGFGKMEGGIYSAQTH